MKIMEDELTMNIKNAKDFEGELDKMFNQESKIVRAYGFLIKNNEKGLKAKLKRAQDKQGQIMMDKNDLNNAVYEKNNERIGKLYTKLVERYCF